MRSGMGDYVSAPLKEPALFEGMQHVRSRGVSLLVRTAPSAAAAAIALVLALAAIPAARAAQPVLQRGYDANVSGANLTETTLNTSNVSPSTFGLLFKLPVDDSVFAQPLYMPSVQIPGQGTHNVVYVATMSDTLYAFDADAGGLALWSVNFASTVGATAVALANYVYGGNRNLIGNMGILSTPVIDPSTNILYLVASTLENGSIVYRLHAVNIATGTEPYPNVVISGSANGQTFNARNQWQRASLVISGSQVVIAFGPFQEEDGNPGYSGWVMAYNKATLKQSGIFSTQGNPRGGSVWQSGRPPVVDGSGYVYVLTANGYYNSNGANNGYDGISNFSESLLKLDPANALALKDWFTPSTWQALDNGDLDLSGSGPMMIPGTTTIAGGGKQGVLYLLNSTALGKGPANQSSILQQFQITGTASGPYELRGGPVYWQRSAAQGGPLLFDWGAAPLGSTDVLKAFAFNGTTLNTTPTAQGTISQVWPGGILALSANGGTPGSGVLWATAATCCDAENNPPTPGALYAFNAANVATELWDSTMNPSRDAFGNFGKFVPPVVANGKVYVATWSNQVAVYGLLLNYTVSPTSAAFGAGRTNVASAPLAITLKNTGNGALPITSITLSTPSPNPFSQTNTCGSSVAVGSSCTINVVFDPILAGETTATLSINAGAAGTQTLTLSGTGVQTSTVFPPDFNGDGTSDVLWLNSSAGDMGIWIMHGGAVSAWKDLGTPPAGWTIAGTGDFNGDGTSDILWHNTTTGDVGVWIMQGGAFSAWKDLGVPGAGWTIAGTGDFNGDGTSDILWHNTTTGDVGVWIMQGGAFSAWKDLGVPGAGWTIAGTGDFNGDGTTDILWHNTTTGDVGVWIMQGGAFSAWKDLGTPAAGSNIAGTGDFNGDGTTDILWHNTTTGDVGIWLMKGGAIASWIDLGVPGAGWTIAGTGDFSNTGTSDILWRKTATGEVGIWFMKGGAIASWLDLGVVPTAWSVVQ
jgi:hypothetical protein